MTEEAPQGDVPAPAAPETESAPVTEDVAEKTTAEAGEKEGDVISPVQKRFDKLTWEKGELSRRAEAAERRAQELERMLFGQQRQEPKPEPEALKPPTLESVGYDEAKYTAAVLEFTRAEAARAAQEVLKAERAREQQEGRAKSFKAREAEFSAKTEDYQSKVYDPTLPITEAMRDLITESEMGPQVAYYLANNRDVTAQLAQLPSIQIARELGKIEAKLSIPKPVPVVSKAPTPPPKLDTADSEAVKVRPTDPESDKEMSDSEWMKARERQLKRKANR